MHFCELLLLLLMLHCVIVFRVVSVLIVHVLSFYHLLMFIGSCQASFDFLNVHFYCLLAKITAGAAVVFR